MHKFLNEKGKSERKIVEKPVEQDQIYEKEALPFLARQLTHK